MTKRRMAYLAGAFFALAAAIDAAIALEGRQHGSLVSACALGAAGIAWLAVAFRSPRCDGTQMP